MKNYEERSSKSMSNILENVSIKVRKWYYNQNNKYIFELETHNTQTNEIMQSVTRKLNEMDSLSSYIIKKYGGFIVPIIQSSRILSKDIDSISDKIQFYLEDLRTNEHSSKDANFYCFLFEQAMAFPQQQAYTKVLANASNMSKKYLNAIFTRKQFPQQKQAMNLINLYQKLQIKFIQYESVKEFTISAINEQRSLQEIKSIFSELSGSLCQAAQLQQSKMIYTQKVLLMSNRYLVQTKEAFSRWEILIEGVRELQNNLFKGLHEDESKFESRSLQLKTWTQTLGQQFKSMSSYFDSIMDYLCHFIQQLKNQTINCDLAYSEKAFLDPNEQNLTQNNAKSQIQQILNPEENVEENRSCNKNRQLEFADSKETLSEGEFEQRDKEKQKFSGQLQKFESVP